MTIVPTNPVPDREKIAIHYGDILNELGLDGAEGTRNTARRAASALLEMTEGYRIDVAKLFTTFESPTDQMIAVDRIPFVSTCEHHLLPFVGHAGVAYVPGEKDPLGSGKRRIIGLSKIPRLVDAHARRLQTQERMTEGIAADIQEHAKPAGVCVIVEASHLCCTARGIRKAGVVMKTSALRGVMLTRPEARTEAFALLGR